MASKTPTSNPVRSARAQPNPSGAKGGKGGATPANKRKSVSPATAVYTNPAFEQVMSPNQPGLVSGDKAAKKVQSAWSLGPPRILVKDKHTSAPPPPAPAEDSPPQPAAGAAKPKNKPPPPRKPEPVKQERVIEVVKREKLTEADKAHAEKLIDELRNENPELAVMIETQIKQDFTSVYTAELVCMPNEAWTKGHKRHSKYPDLGDHTVVDSLIQLFVEISRMDDSHTLGLDPVSVLKVPGNTMSKHVFQVVSSSKEGLENIINSEKTRMFKGYHLTFFQPLNSKYGFRFQLNIQGLPLPFSKWTLSQWIECVQSQGLDMSAVTHIMIGKKITLGKAARLTGLLDIYVKPAAMAETGCTGALSDAGTALERITKKITFPPTNILLGRNPESMSQDLIDSGLLKGQYYSPAYNPAANALPGIPEYERGKTYLRPIIPIAMCKYCLGEPHGSRELCMYRDICRMCLVHLPSLQNKGFKHSCHNLIVEDMSKPPLLDIERKRAYDAGTPENETQAAYIPSEGFKKQKTALEAAQAAIKARKAAELEHQILIERQHREAQAEALAQQEQLLMRSNPTEGSDPEDHNTTPQESPPTSPHREAYMDLETQKLLEYEDDI